MSPPKAAVNEFFVLPERRGSPTGGNVYNRRLLGALRRSGWDFEVGSLTEALACREVARFWVDSLYLPEVPRLRQACSANASIHLLVHYFPSLVATAPSERRRWRRVEADAFRCSQGFVVTSPFAGSELAKRGVGGRLRMVLPPAPSLRVGRVPRRRADRFRGLMVANLVPGKGVLDFLGALEAALGHGARFSLEIVGRTDMDPAYAGACRCRVAGSRALRGRVQLLGSLGPVDLRRRYLANAFFVSASRMESFGMALQDARVFGLHLLVRSGGFAGCHVRTEADGLCCATVERLAEATARLITDPVHRSEVQRNTTPTRTDYDWDQAARRFREWAEAG